MIENENGMYKHKIWDGFLFILYLISVLFVTVFSREPQLIHSIRWIPFRSLYEWINTEPNYGLTFLLNICLFIPLGFLLANFITRNHKIQLWWLSFNCLAISAVIEAIQFITYRGICDMDDLISNTLGGVVGGLGWLIVQRFKVFRPIRKTIPIVLVCAGLVGYGIFFLRGEGTIISRYELQLAFDIVSVENHNDEIVLNGYCYLYQSVNESYQIVLVDEDTREEYPITTTITGTDFTALAPSLGNYEVDVVFKHHSHKLINTKVYINNGRIKYVPESVPTPSASGMDEVIQGGILKAYNAKYDTFIYQYDGRIYWLIGNELPPNTEIIYHLHTDKPEKLPDERRQYKSDNLGFHIEEKSFLTAGNYKVYSSSIPNEYPIIAIGIGFSNNGTLDWLEFFRLSQTYK